MKQVTKWTAFLTAAICAITFLLPYSSALAEETSSTEDITTGKTEENSFALTGDVDLDNSLTVTDAVLMQKYLLNEVTLTADQCSNADIQADAMLNVVDLIRLKQLLMQPVPEMETTMEWNGKTYEMTLFDDFSGDTLDETIWSPCPEWERADVGAYWDNDMISLDGNGNLVLSVAKDEENNRYISGAIRSKDKFEQTYGYFEARCKLQKIDGFWSAFWLWGEGVMNVDQSGEDGSEIDIMESAYRKESLINHAVHYDGYAEAHQSTSTKIQRDGLYEGYHTFGLEWTPEEYIFYVDGEETWRTSYGGVCKNPLYLKLSTEVGTWAGTLNAAELPGAFWVDYVKVYQCVSETQSTETSLLPSMEHWNYYVNDGAATVTMDTNAQSLSANVTETGVNSWDIQAQAYNLPLENGTVYQVQFDASCTNPTTMDVGILRYDGTDYPVCWAAAVPLTEAHQTFTYLFTMRKESLSDWFLYFNFAGSTGEYCIDNIRLTKLGTNQMPAVSDWTYYASNGAATFTADADIHAFRTNVTETGVYEWDIQSMANGILLERGKQYELYFEASCTNDAILSFNLCRNDNGSYPCCYSNSVALTTEMQSYTLSFTMRDDTQSDWYFGVNYAMQSDEYVIQNVILRETGTADIDAEPDYPYSYTVSERSCARDGKNIYGLAYVPETAEPVPLVILSHELGNTHETMKHYAEALAGNGYAAYIYDFCGGSAASRSDGVTTEMSIMTEKADLEAVLEAAKTWDFVDTERIVLLGGSQGGVVTSLAAADHAEEIAGTILLYPAYALFDLLHAQFADLSEVPETFVFNGWIDVSRNYAADVWKLDPYSEIGKNEKPVLILHGDQDVLVDMSYSERATAAYQNAELHVIAGGAHIFRDAPLDAATAYVLEFMEQVV